MWGMRPKSLLRMKTMFAVYLERPTSNKEELRALSAFLGESEAEVARHKTQNNVSEAEGSESRVLSHSWNDMAVIDSVGNCIQTLMLGQPSTLVCPSSKAPERKWGACNITGAT